MHTSGITVGIVASLVAICIGIFLMLAMFVFTVMTAAAIVDWTIKFGCFLLGRRSYPSFLSIWHSMLLITSSDDLAGSM